MLPTINYQLLYFTLYFIAYNTCFHIHVCSVELEGHVARQAWKEKYACLTSNPS